MPYNKQVTNRACSSSTGEHWPSVVAILTSLRRVLPATTLGQCSQVRSSRSVSKQLIFNNYSLNREIEKNYCFSTYTQSDLNKIREETIKKYDLTDRSGQLDTRQFKNRSLQNFQTWQFTSLSLRKQQRNDLNGTAKSLNCFLT